MQSPEGQAAANSARARAAKEGAEISTFSVVIPARLASERLPGKLLRPVGGHPALWWTIRAAKGCGAQRVLVACDSEEIAAVAQAAEVEYCLTQPELPSGTDRCLAACEVADFAASDLIVNLQGDEVAMPADNITSAAQCLLNSGADIATLVQPLPPDEAQRPERVKVAVGVDNRAVYFSRAAIPWDAAAAAPQTALWHHLGLYAYRLETLRQFASLPRGRLEQSERLEQLRALEAGMHIAVAEAPSPAQSGLDTEADLQRLDRLLSALVSQP